MYVNTEGDLKEDRCEQIWKEKKTLASPIAKRNNKLIWLQGDILSSNPDKLIVFDNSSRSSSLTSEETTLLTQIETLDKYLINATSNQVLQSHIFYDYLSSFGTLLVVTSLITDLKSPCIIVTDGRHILDCTLINSFAEIKTIFDFRLRAEESKATLHFSTLFWYNSSSLFKKYAINRNLSSDKLNFIFEICMLSFVLQDDTN